MQTILYVDDDLPNLDMFRRTFDEQFDLYTAESGPKALELLTERAFAVVISDQRMDPMTGIELLATVEQRWPISTRILLTAFSDRDLLLAAIHKGRVHDFVLKPWSIDDVGLRLHRAVSEYAQRAERERLRDEVAHTSGLDEIVGLEAGLKAVIDQADRIAASDSTVIIRGENGTGKELFARRIHARSARRGGPFIAVNCAALSESLLESELFGHEPSSFTGARERVGRFQQAHGGTLFLDEIGDIPERVQVVLLRVLQERCFERVGGTRTLAVDFRLITATNQPLEQRVEEGRFRRDLYHRIDVSRLRLPPLRERPEDIETLARHFLASANRRLELLGDAIEALQRYDWPGNVRELKNVIERATVLADVGARLGANDLSLELTPPRPVVTSGIFDEIARDEIGRICDALRRSGGNVSKAAKIFGAPRSTLDDKIKKYNIK